MKRMLLLAALVAAPAAAHEAPSGWTYDLDCCSAHDCYQIDAGTICLYAPAQS